jgi:hypothetical protein
VNFFETVERVFETWHYDHPRILYALMRSLKPKVAVEVGTYRGYAACYMAQALKENGAGHLYCIDDFSEGMQKKYDANHWHANLAACRVSEWATLLVGKSSEVEWPVTVDFAYIDGWHGYKDVSADFRAAAFRGAECICLDDTESTVGPSLFVQRMRGSYTWDVCEILRDCGLAVFIRRKAKKPVGFCQEPNSNSGVVMTEWTTEQKRDLLTNLAVETGVDYSDFVYE